MSYRKPFAAVPITLSPRYRRTARTRAQRSTWAWLGAAALVGAVLGTASVAATPDRRAMIIDHVRPVAAAFATLGRRAPRRYGGWGGCDALRAAGVTPIYRGEPLYRIELDADGDGIACEPYARR